MPMAIRVVAHPPARGGEQAALSALRAGDVVVCEGVPAWAPLLPVRRRPPAPPASASDDSSGGGGGGGGCSVGGDGGCSGGGDGGDGGGGGGDGGAGGEERGGWCLYGWGVRLQEMRLGHQTVYVA